MTHRAAKLAAAPFVALAIAVVSVAWRGASAPRPWAAEETPVAFWAWRNQAPTDEEVAGAARAARAHTIFLRAGQIDYAGGGLRRIRTVAGRFPRALPLHLVYNGTRSLLVDFEGVDANALAATIIDTFTHDAERARAEGAQVAGLQLDIDSPTRLLPRYARVVRAVRARLSPDVRLSVTGLVTWMDSPAALNALLDAVDFWIPQCYGAEIPARIERDIPISSPAEVRRAVARAREFGRPFYAGLSSYGYALLYSAGGSLIALRGDLDAARVAQDANFELLERRPFAAPPIAARTGEPSSEARRDAPLASEWRYVFRARNDATLDGLTVRAGDRLLINLPDVESLRAAARAARAEGGEHFLGLCLFRLPTRDDATAMPLAQIAAALADTPPAFAAEARLARAAGQRSAANNLRLTIENAGTASALMGDDDALSLTLRVPAGSLRAVSNLAGFSSFETLCGDASAAGTRAPAQPCSARRANIVRLQARAWPAGARAAATLSFDREPPSAIQTTIAARLADAQTITRAQVLPVSSGEQP